MKTAIIAIARNENPYIRELAEHHLGIGFDKIFVCDNGFGGEENPKDARRKIRSYDPGNHYVKCIVMESSESRIRRF